MKSTASKKYKDGRIVVEVDRDGCSVRWFFVVGREPQNYGGMDIELYVDDTWLPYEETYGPARWMPKAMEPIIYELFRKCGMRNEE